MNELNELLGSIEIIESEMLSEEETTNPNGGCALRAPNSCGSAQSTSTQPQSER